VKFNAEEIGFTLKTDDKTLREIEAIQEETVKATQSIKKFAWR
jgi:Cu/Ag efflux protein CusF